MRRDLGDFQTPPALVAAVLDRLGPIGARWPRVLEPSCGRGHFLAGVLARESVPREVRGVEIQEAHCAAARAACGGRAEVLRASLFALDLRRDLCWQGSGPLLVVGNPPWVTNAALGALGSDNLPKKSNFKGLRGIDARTGAANFDSAEAIWLKLLDELADVEATIALLCKTSVARSVLEHARRAGLPVADAAVDRIDAARWFQASVDACLLRVTLGASHQTLPLAKGKLEGVLGGPCPFDPEPPSIPPPRGADRPTHLRFGSFALSPRERVAAQPPGEGASGTGHAYQEDALTRPLRRHPLPGGEGGKVSGGQPSGGKAEMGDALRAGGSCARIPVFPDLHATEPETVMGFVRGRLVADLESYEPSAFADGQCALTWRQGLKHDAATVMELAVEPETGTLRNKRGEAVAVEPEWVYPLLKGADLQQPIGRQARRAVIVTQTRIGEDTKRLERAGPRLWSYLTAHADAFERRKSSIYRGKPPFSLFGVGPYSFAPYKVAVSGLHKAPRFRVVGPVGGRPVMLDDTCYFLPCASADHAQEVAALLNDPATLRLVRALSFPASKRPITKAVLQRIDLDAVREHRAIPTRSRSNEVLSEA